MNLYRKIDLLKPLFGAERAIDTLYHYHITSEAPDNSTGPATRGNTAATLRQHFFPCLMEFRFQRNEIQRLAHVPELARDGCAPVECTTRVGV